MNAPKLSKRELEVATLQATGYTHKAIAATLAISDSTVDFYIMTFRNKTKVKSIAETVHYMIANGYIKVGQCL